MTMRLTYDAWGDLWMNADPVLPADRVCIAKSVHPEYREIVKAAVQASGLFPTVHDKTELHPMMQQMR